MIQCGFHWHISCFHDGRINGFILILFLKNEIHTSYFLIYAYLFYCIKVFQVFLKEPVI